VRKLAANVARSRVQHEFFCTDAAASVSGSNRSQSSHVINSPYTNHGFIYVLSHLN
jgi:hypothetical protein